MARVMGCEGEFIVRGGGMRWARRGEWGVDDGEGGGGGCMIQIIYPGIICHYPELRDK